MLNLTKGKRIFSAVLVAVMLFAAVFAVGAFSDTEKSKGEMLLGTTGNVKLSATESVDTAIIYENEDIFTYLEITQTGIDSITVKGTLDADAYADVIGGDIGVRIGEDAVKSHVMEIVVEADYSFELVFVLNPVFCSEYGNKIPVIVSYTKSDDPGYVCELDGVIGVITYDPETGALGYPAGAEYLDENAAPKALTTKYVPADAYRDEDGKITVMYQDLTVTFVAEEIVIADAPAGDVGSIKDVDGDKVILNVVAGLEYGYIEVGGSITNDYGSEFNWVLAEGDTVEFTGLKPDVTYTYWARVPANGDVLASAPVFIGKGDTLNAADADAKNAFLEKYAEVVILGTELYSPEDPEVTASRADAASLLSLYDGLSDEVKALDVVSEKATYLVITNFLAKYQDIYAAAYTAEKYADLRDEYSYEDILAALDGFGGLVTELLELHGDDPVVFKDIVKLTVSYFKLYVCAPIDANDEAKDLKYEAVAYAADLAKKELDTLTPDEFDDFVSVCAQDIMLAAEEYDIVLYLKANEEELTKESRTIASLENLLDQLLEVETFTSMGEELYSIMYDMLNTELGDAYIAEIEKLIPKYENAIDEAYEFISMLYFEAIDAIKDENDIYLEYPDNKDIYLRVLAFDKAMNCYVNALTELEGMKDGKGEEIVDIIDEYIYNIDGIASGMFDILEDDDYEDYSANIVKGIEYQVASAKAELAFIDKKAAAKAEIEALKDNNQAVINAANKYHPEIDVLEFNYENIDALNANIDAIVAAAKAETDFEKKREEVKVALAADVAARKATGRHSAAQIAQLESYLAEAVTLVNNLDFAAGKVIADLEAQQAASLAKFATVNVITVSAGNVPYFGDLSAVEYPADYNFDNGLWGNITNMNGFSGALTMNIKKLSFEGKFKVDKIIVATGELTQEQAIEAAKDKAVLYKLDIALLDGTTAFSGADNGLYTVRVLIPADIREESGLYVISQEGETTYVYETTREGNFLVFKTAHFSEFLIVGDKTVNLTWLIIVLAILLAAEVGVVVFFVIKKKKKGVTAASIVPFLAIAFVPASAIPAVALMGAFALVGAAAATTTVVNYKKKTI